MYAEAADPLWSGELQISSCAIEAADNDNRLVGLPLPPEYPKHHYDDHDRENRFKRVFRH